MLEFCKTCFLNLKYIFKNFEVDQAICFKQICDQCTATLEIQSDINWHGFKGLINYGT